MPNAPSTIVPPEPSAPSSPSPTPAAATEAARAEATAGAERAGTPATVATPAAGGLGIAPALGEELAAFSRQLIEDSSERTRELAAARSLADLVEIQTRQLQAVSDAWLQHSARMRAIYLEALQNTPDDDRR